MSAPLRILVVDDDHVIRKSTTLQLSANGDFAQAVENPFLALKELEQGRWDVVISDLRMPGMSGLEFLDRITAAKFDVDVIIVTAFASVETAVEAMQKGAHDYMIKPFQYEELRLRLERIREQRSTRHELQTLHAILDDVTGESGLLGNSRQMVSVHKRIEIFAKHDAPVLITGETGTGKELVARALHEQSTRAGQPFIPLACGAIPPELAESELFGHEKGSFTGAHTRAEGVFERADGGSVLLDDIDDLPLNIQVKLLRVLQEGTLMRVGGDREIHVDARIIATSKVDLKRYVEDGRFRDDLYYRLCGLEIDLPPLRERGDDVLILAHHFLQLGDPDGSGKPVHISPEVAQMLRRYQWPGNVRELRRTIESARVLSCGEDIVPSHLPLSIQRMVAGNAGHGKVFTLDLAGCQKLDMVRLTHEFEHTLMMWALTRSGGQMSKAARLLGMPRTTFQSKLAALTNNKQNGASADLSS